MLESNQRVINDVAASIPKLVEPQGFEPRLRPYEWNEVVAVCILVRINFLRVLPLHQGSEKNWLQWQGSNLRPID